MMKKKIKKEKRDWGCFHCGFEGTEKEVEDHKCSGDRIVIDKDGNKHKIIN